MEKAVNASATESHLSLRLRVNDLPFETRYKNAGHDHSQNES